MKNYPTVNMIIAKVFSKTPGPRLIVEGDFSGEQFRNECLEPAFRKAVTERYLLLVDLDGAAGYGTSFLEESFGGLIRDHNFDLETIKKHLQIKSEDEPEWVAEINEYLEKAEQERLAK